MSCRARKLSPGSRALYETLHCLQVGWGEGPPARGDVDDFLPHLAHGLAQPVGVAAADHDGGDLRASWFSVEEGLSREIEGVVSISHLNRTLSPSKRGL